MLTARGPIQHLVAPWQSMRCRIERVKQGVNDMDQMLSKWQPTALSLLRIVSGLLLLQFGVAKIFKFPPLPYFANPPPLIMVAGGLELVLGALLFIGLFTRISAFILSGEMAFAYFIGHMFKDRAAPYSCRSSTTAASRSCCALPVSICRPPAAVRTASMRCARRAATLRHCLRQTQSVCARERRTKQSIFLYGYGLLRGACHRARVRATRRLARTAA